MMSKLKEAMTKLLLELTEPTMKDMEGKLRAQATARLKCIPTGKGEREVEARFMFTAPMGPIEREELSWYLERYYSWPSGVFQERARKMEALLPIWGKGLYDAVFSQGKGQLKDVLQQWQKSGGNGGARRFTIYVDKAQETTNASEAATMLLTLPWELLHDGTGYLFQGDSPVQVRRQLPNRKSLETVVTESPIRVLLVSPRPEDNQVAYFDHRISALPLVSALESLGELAQLTILTPPTFEALGEELLKAKQAGTPYHVVHFDGHGAFAEAFGVGGLCFEDPQDIEELQQRNSKFINANQIGALMRDYGIPLVFLDACQSAKTEKEPGASVAAALLHHGVASVVAMSHTVLVETTRRFVKAFYRQLAQGQPVGEAMSAGRRELKENSFRFKIFGAGKLELQDWFVPVLYQEKEDVQLLTSIRSRPMQEIDKKALAARMGYLPDEPAHCFVGRSRELLMLERLLALEEVNYAVVVGQGGEGKTTLAAELARWLLRTDRFKRAVFVCMEDIYEVRTVVDKIGQQLLPNYSVAQYKKAELMTEALLPIEEQLREESTLLLLDNMESILPPRDKEQTARLEAEALEEFFTMCSRLNAVADTRFLFTSREALPKPFDSEEQTVILSRLDEEDAIALVHQTMTEAGLTPQEEDDGVAQPEVEALVQSVNCHARSLVLLVHYINRFGVRHTTENLGHIMADLHKKYLDERERSLFASVQLSLQRLAPQLRAKLKPLGAFQDGGQVAYIGKVLQLSDNERNELVKELTQLNLAESVAYDFLSFHPALCPFLWGQMTVEEQKQSTANWVQSMNQLANFLYEQQAQDAQLSAVLTTLELPNLMYLLHHTRDQLYPEATVKLSTQLEQLISYLGRRDLRAVVTGIREEESRKLGVWSHIHFDSSRSRIQHLLGSGNLPQALTEVRALLEQCLQEGNNAYEAAAHDTATAYFLHGRVLKRGGAADAALSQSKEAFQRFQLLADQGNSLAARMASASLTETGDCLRSLGRLDEAALAYEEAIKRAELLKDERGIAVKKNQLGTVRLEQKRYEDALDAYNESRKIFESLGEPSSVAASWYQTGRVHEGAGQYESSEYAYRKSLAVWVQQNDPLGEASTLDQLGTLYGKMNRLEDSVTFHKKATEICSKIEDQGAEGRSRGNLSRQLIKLNRYTEAREEIRQAIKCKEPYGHAAKPWNAWDILCDLEHAEGNAKAASLARGKAFKLYLAYRNDGGENHEFGGRLYKRDGVRYFICLSRPRTLPHTFRSRSGYSKNGYSSGNDGTYSIELMD